MNWSVIYQIDLWEDAYVGYYLPEVGEWHETEGDEEFDHDYFDVDEGQHRKLIAFLTNEEFEHFLDRTLYPHSVGETCGMIGGLLKDGIYTGLMPAWCIACDPWSQDRRVFSMDAYVCPIPENEEEEQFLANHQDIGNWIMEKYINA